MTTTQELAYQARIRELREALAQYTNVVSSINNPNSFAPEVIDSGDAARLALSHPDDLSALEAYVREEKRKVLDEAMKEFGEDAFLQNGTKAVNVLRGMAKELK